MGKAQPNLLFLMVDQLRTDHTGFMPDATFSTPVLSSLAEGSTVFTRCQSVNPICMPARSALLTGRYPHQIGTQAMSGDLPKGFPTVPGALQSAGYWTAMAGKLHILQSWPWGVPRGKGVNLVELADEMAEELGYDWFWESSGKQLAVKNYCHWCEHLEKKGILEDVRDYIEAAGSNKNHYTDDLNQDGNPWPFDEADHVDVVTGDKAIEALRVRPEDQPFALKVSFCSPHKPFDPPQRYLDAVPYVEEDDFVGPEAAEYTPEQKQTFYKLRRAYRATVQLLDDQIGRILNELRAQGELDNTVILFTTDHGEMMGDHGRVQKGIYWRQSLTVPTLIRDPKVKKTRTVDTPVELTDLCATQLEYAGLNPHEALSESFPMYRNILPCRSMKPCVELGESIRDFSFSESYQGWHCVQSEHRKYVRLRNEEQGSFTEFLFDVHNDPDEIHNLAESEPGEVRRHRDYLDWVIMCTPAAQSRWAPLME